MDHMIPFGMVKKQSSKNKNKTSYTKIVIVSEVKKEHTTVTKVLTREGTR